VGDAVGANVGVAVGVTVGALVGLAEGAGVGGSDGAFVGAAAGAVVEVEPVGETEDAIEHTHPVLCNSHHPSFQLNCESPSLAASTRTHASPPKDGSDGLQLVYVLLQPGSVHVQVPFSSARPIHCAGVPRQAWPFASSRMKVFSALLSIHAGLPGAHAALHSLKVRSVPITVKHFPLAL
jgi:hypothetical protein